MNSFYKLAQELEMSRPDFLEKMIDRRTLEQDIKEKEIKEIAQKWKDMKLLNQIETVQEARNPINKAKHILSKVRNVL